MTDLSWEGLTRKIRTSISMDATQIANLLNLGQICNIKDHSTKVLVYMLVHLALALRASVEEERASQDVAARVAEEKECGHASISHDTTMTENAGIMSDGANTCDLMVGLMLLIFVSSDFLTVNVNYMIFKNEDIISLRSTSDYSWNYHVLLE
ncbi:hypothetical protein C5167_007128 [Papaver somniferum]|uniref:Uncharacterized protein n=1 Tax=Papaver somniferum TaxID=3469 RepID=A0A4Y7JFA0_PAPSO|nr:hypothetical protein C5167_007128 [Papaver somniferum]